MEKQLAMSGLAQLLGAIAADRTDLDLTCFAATTVQQAIDKGIGPLLFRTTKSNPNSAASTLQPILHGAEITSRILVHEQLDSLQCILDALGSSARHVTLLKGISTCLQYFPEPHMRTMGDIDLLVTRERQAELEELLRDTGYCQQSALPPSYYQQHHHSMPFFHPTRKVWIEVHTQLFPPQSHLAQDRIFTRTHIENNTVPYNFRGLSTNVLRSELEIAYLAAHWGPSFPFPRGLMPILDMMYLLKVNKTSINWKDFLARLRGSAATPFVYLMLSFLQYQQLCGPGPSVLRRLQYMQKTINDPVLAILLRIFKKYLVDGYTFGRFATFNNVALVWSTLLAPHAANRNLIAVPYRLIFPPEHPHRFSLGLLGQRLRSVLRTRLFK